MWSFQICYDGDLTLEVATAVRRLKGYPNFDKSWMIALSEEQTSVSVLHDLLPAIVDGSLVVAQLNPSRNRPFLLVRHGITENFDYRPLYGALNRLGDLLELPLPATFILRTDDPSDSLTLGEHLGELCPYDSLMVVGISHDFTIWNAAEGEFTAAEEWLIRNEELRS